MRVKFILHFLWMMASFFFCLGSEALSPVTNFRQKEIEKILLEPLNREEAFYEKRREGFSCDIEPPGNSYDYERGMIYEEGRFIPRIDKYRWRGEGGDVKWIYQVPITRLFLRDVSTHPETLLVTKFLETCTGVAIRAFKDGKEYRGIGHFFIAEGSRKKSLREDVSYIHNLLIRKGFSSVKMLFDYFEGSYDSGGTNETLEGEEAALSQTYPVVFIRRTHKKSLHHLVVEGDSSGLWVFQSEISLENNLRPVNYPPGERFFSAAA